MEKIVKRIRMTYLGKIIASLCFLGLGIFVFLSCQEQDFTPVSDSRESSYAEQRSSITDEDENSCQACSGIWTPKNMEAREVDPGTIYVLNNEEYEYIGVDLNDQIIPGIKGISLTCKCTKGSGGCSPVRMDNVYFCIPMSGCVECKSKVKGLSPRNEPGQFEGIELKSGGFIKKKVEVHFATQSELLEQAYVFPAMAKVPEVIEAVKEFEAKNGGTDKVVKVLVSIAGRIAILDVDAEIAELNQAVVLSGTGDPCNCSSRKGSCEYATFGAGELCDATNCKRKCTLNTGLKVGGESLEYTMYNF